MNKSTSNKQCNICDKVFKTIKSFQNHIIQVHGEKDEKKWKCNIYNRCLANKGSLEFHINSAHQDKKAYNCESCGNIAIYPLSLGE